MDKKSKFLKELTELSKKHNLYISGEFDNIHIEDENGFEEMDKLEWVDSRQEYIAVNVGD